MLGFLSHPHQDAQTFSPSMLKLFQEFPNFMLLLHKCLFLCHTETPIKKTGVLSCCGGKSSSSNYRLCPHQLRNCLSSLILHPLPHYCILLYFLLVWVQNLSVSTMRFSTCVDTMACSPYNNESYECSVLLMLFLPLTQLRFATHLLINETHPSTGPSRKRKLSRKLSLLDVEQMKYS